MGSVVSTAGTTERLNEHFVNVVPEKFLPLVISMMTKNHVTAADLSRRTKLSKTKIELQNIYNRCNVIYRAQ